MKIVIILVLLLQVVSGSVLAQGLLSRKISITFSGEPVTDALRKIEKVANVEFGYNAGNLGTFKSPARSPTRSIRRISAILFALPAITN